MTRAHKRPPASSIAARRRAVQHWPMGYLRRDLEEAAEMLDKHGEHLLADWLLCCRVEFYTQVATGVAAHALRRIPPVGNELNAYDLLVTRGIASFAQTSDLFFNGNAPGGMLDWAPEPAWLHE